MLETVVSVEADAEQRAVGRYRRRPDSRHKDTLAFKIIRQRDGGLGLETMAEQGLDAAAVVGLMAASVQLVPPGSRLSSAELLQECSLDRLQAVLARRA